MEFLVLGPLEVRRDGEPVDIRGSKRRALLALLILHANEVIRTDLLVEELWGEHRPTNAQAALQNHVSRLRRDLGEDVLVRRPWGYVLRADQESIDLRRFEALVAEARTLPARERRAKLAEALALWRGKPLADIADEPALARSIAWLEEIRLSALEQRIDTDHELEAEPGLVGELENLVAQHPMRERLRGQLILALYRAGRQADALETYRETRRVLVEELGIEPGPELRELEQAILRQDPALTQRSRPAPDHVESAPPSSWRWPRSTFVFAATLLLLGGGALAAVLATRGGTPEGPPAALPSTRTTTVAVTTRSTTEPPATTTTARPRHRQKQRPVTHVTTPVATVVPTIATTTTRPKIVTHHKPPPAKEPQLVYWLTDDFTDPAVDFGMWHIASHGSGVDVDEQDGRLVFSVAPDATTVNTYGVDRHYGTNCLLIGDFDARVEFELLDWPGGNGMSLTLGAYFPPPNEDFLAVNRVASSSLGPDNYNGNIGGRSVQTSDLAGALRITRTKDVMTAYYRYGTEWVKLGSTMTTRAGTNLILSFIGGDGIFGHLAASASFDNFRATAAGVRCDGVPIPPRRPKT